jgi:predicted kinase
LGAAARAYFDLALALLQPVPARLVAVGGLSGSGKSTVAAALAPALGPPPGARILASDRIRKRLFEVSAETRLPDTAYRPEVSDEV